MHSFAPRPPEKGGEKNATPSPPFSGGRGVKQKALAEKSARAFVYFLLDQLI